MIQPLRTAHRRAFATLAVLLPAMVLAGLAARHSHPTEQAISEAAAKDHLAQKSEILWQQRTSRSGIYSDLNHPQDRYVIFESAPDSSEPDLLVYWSADEPQGIPLPPTARLLGALSATKSFMLPGDVKGAGYLVLYSLAHQSVVDMAAVEKRP